METYKDFHIYIHVIHVNVWQNQYSIVKQNKVKIKIKTKTNKQTKKKDKELLDMESIRAKD